jgi:phage baseplate assembly protein W
MSYDLKLTNGDLVLSSNKDLDLVKDNDKLFQDMIKILISPLGSNKIHTWYGCDIGSIVVGNVFNSDIVTDSAISQVRSSLENLQMLQKTQARNQNVSNYEKIVAIQNIFVGAATSDPRLIEVKASVITGGLKDVKVRFFIRL